MTPSSHALPRCGTDFIATASRKLCQKNKKLRSCYTDYLRRLWSRIVVRKKIGAISVISG